VYAWSETRCVCGVVCVVWMCGVWCVWCLSLGVWCGCVVGMFWVSLELYKLFAEARRGVQRVRMVRDKMYVCGVCVMCGMCVCVCGVCVRRFRDIGGAVWLYHLVSYAQPHTSTHTHTHTQSTQNVAVSNAWHIWSLETHTHTRTQTTKHTQ